MIRIFTALFALVLMGGGCMLFQTEVTTETSTPSEESTDGQEFEHPPAIEMTANGQAVAGVEGSYCTQMLCVDKVGPVELVAEAGLGFTTIAREPVVLSSDAPLDGLGYYIMSADGTMTLESTVELGADDERMLWLPAHMKGDYYVVANAAFTGLCPSKRLL